MNIQYSAGDADPRFEDSHWWIRSRFLLIDGLLARMGNSRPWRVLEIGCGTGVNLRHLETRHADKISDLIGTDPYAEPAKRGKTTIQRDLPEGVFDLILVMDVLEHTDTPVALLEEVRRRLHPQGRLLITVPAFQWLWSSYDVIAHHKKRYSAAALQKELAKGGFKADGLFFLFGSLFPLAVLQRVWIRWTGSNPHAFKPVHPWVNALFYRITWLEMSTWMPYNRWFGSSIVAIAAPQNT